MNCTSHSFLLWHICRQLQSLFKHVVVLCGFEINGTCQVQTGSSMRQKKKEIVSQSNKFINKRARHCFIGQNRLKITKLIQELVEDTTFIDLLNFSLFGFNKKNNFTSNGSDPDLLVCRTFWPVQGLCSLLYQAQGNGHE